MNKDQAQELIKNLEKDPDFSINNNLYYLSLYQHLKGMWFVKIEVNGLGGFLCLSRQDAEAIKAAALMWLTWEFRPRTDEEIKREQEVDSYNKEGNFIY